MASRANVTSIDALESFRASVINFLTKARRAADEVGDEVRRTRVWVQQEQRLKWEGEFRRRQKALDQAQQELLSARISGLRDSTPVQKAAVIKAERALREAEEKLRNVKHWNQRYDGFADPLTKRLENLRRFLDQDMPEAVVYLSQAQRILEAYAETPGPETGPAPPQEPNQPDS